MQFVSISYSCLFHYSKTKLVKMFSRQLISKASVKNINDVPKLSEYPNTEQWLKVVGLPSSTVKVSVAVPLVSLPDFDQILITSLYEEYPNHPFHLSYIRIAYTVTAVL